MLKWSPKRGWSSRTASSRVAIFILGLGLSCAQQRSQVPIVAPSHTLELPGAALPADVPFRVVHSGPRGEASARPTIQIVFSRPLRALDADVKLPAGVTLSPVVPGAWQWLGTSAIVFSPEKGELPLATHFRVVLPAGIEALDGQVLTEAHEFEFETPRPRVASSWPGQYYRSESRDAQIHIHVNQDVEPAELLHHVSASVGEKTFRLSAARGAQRGEIVLTPLEKWPLGATVEYVVHPGLRGTEGELGSTLEYRENFGVHGPLEARALCSRNRFGQCHPGSYLGVEFSNPVPALAFARGLSAGGHRLNVDTAFGAEDRTTALSLSPQMLPGDTFTLSFAKGLRDIHGQPLAVFGDAKVVVGDYPQSVVIGFSGDSIVSTERHVPVLARNAPYELITLPLSPEQVVELEQTDEKFDKIAAFPKAQRRRVPVGPKNALTRELIDLDRLLEATRGYGPFAVGVRYQSEDGEATSEVRFAQRTDLGVSAKLGRKQSQVWVTKLGTGEALAGVSVVELGTPGLATTGPDGLAVLAPGTFTSQAAHDGPARYLWVRSGNDQALRSDRETVGGYRIPVPTDFYGQAAELAYLFPERDLFRPGESLWVKAYVRRPGPRGQELVTEHAYQLALVSGDGERLQTLEVKTNTFGALAARLTIPRAASPGYFSLLLLEGERELANQGIQVAEFVPAEFQVRVAPTALSVLAKERASFGIEGSYLYGAPMSGAQVNTAMFRFRTEFVPPSSDGFITDDSAAYALGDESQAGPYIGSFESILDAEGRAQVPLEANFSGMTGPERVELEAEVRDISSRSQSARASLIVHPAEYYVGLEAPRSSFVSLGEVVSPKVRAILPAGGDVPSRPVKLELIRMRYAEVERKTYSGEATVVTELVQEIVGQCQAQSQSSCALRPVAPGQHLVRATSFDPKGRRTRSSFGLYVLGIGDSGYRDSDERAAVQVTLDRASYQVGERAKLLVLSPFEHARAWLTLERDDVIESKLVTLDGRTPSLEIPVTEAFRPNVHVGIHLLEDRARAGKAARPLSESYRFGYAELRVAPEAQRLQVQVSASAPSYRPGDEVSLSISVRDKAEKPLAAEVTLFVVDEGVLALSGYTLPDPLFRFTAPSPLRVETLESREALAEMFGQDPSHFANKGDPGGGGDDGRSNFLTTAYFNPHVVTSESGRAEVRFTLPDNVGRFRVMALAVSTRDQYGRGEASLTVNKELMVRPQLPRFVRDGDEFSASAVLSSLRPSPLDVAVALSTKNLSPGEPAPQTVHLEAKGSGRVDFPLKSKGVGAAELTFLGQAGAYSDKIRLSRQVTSPAVFETVSAYGKTETAVAEQLGALQGIRKDVGSLELTLSSSALVGLEGGYEKLVEYPYECTEQLSSRVLPLLAFRGLAERFGLPVPGNARERIERDLSQIVRRQRGDGGFGLWPESVTSEPWVSPYALWVLHLGKKAGFFVPADVFSRGGRFLTSVGHKREQAELPFAVFSNFVLAQMGKGDPAQLGALSELRQELPLDARALLLWSAATLELDALTKLLLPELESSLTPRGNRVELAPDALAADARGLSSSVRSQALVLAALLKARPDHPLASGLVRALLDARRGGAWQSTQESAFALLALDAYGHAQEAKTPHFSARAFLGDQQVFAPEFAGFAKVAEKRSLPLAGLTLGSALVFDKRGDGTLFYEARLKFARSELPTTPLEAGFAVTRTLRAVSREELTRPLVHSGQDANDFEEGELVLVDIEVLAPDMRRYVVLDDPLPAGFEAIDFSLATSGGALSPELANSNGYSWAWSRSEIRDDRVLYFVDEMPAGLYRFTYLARATTSGRFVTPPTSVHEMYQEQVMARTGSRWVQVRRGKP
jgi:alpha-2-macroglobulin